MNISINLPSYKRADGVKTLSWIPFAKVWVAPQEYEAYKENYPEAEIVKCAEGVQGYGVSRVRNYILRKEFEAGADVVVILDDDMVCIERFNVGENGKFGYAKRRLQTEEVLPFFAKYSQMAKDLGAYFWGLNCNSDSLSYRHYTPFATCAYIGGPVQCFLKGNDCWYDEQLPLKEDYDMTLQQLNKHRVVLRVNMWHYICEQSTNKGGCAAMRNREKEREQLELFRQKWGGDIVRIDTSNKGKTTKQKYEDYNPIIKVPIKGV